MTATDYRQPAYIPPGGPRAHRWRYNSNGWMVGRAAGKRGARPVYWLGPDEDAGYSATPHLTHGCDAMVWPTAEHALAALTRIFPTEVDYLMHGFRIVRVVDGTPDGPRPDRILKAARNA